MPLPGDQEFEAVVGESRWPMAGAVVAVIALTLVIPGTIEISSNIRVLPLLEAVLLVVLIFGDPGRIDRRSKALRRASVALVLILVAGALIQTIVLAIGLINNDSTFRTPRALLEAAAAVWVANNIAFGLLYWEIDCGGAAARVHRLKPHPDFAFPQQLSPEVAPEGWRPRFVDYLYLGFTNATAFSPTDVMPLTPRAKFPMLLQSLASLILLGLVVSRAVNVLGGS